MVSNRWWYVERPFPWLPLVACAVVAALIVSAIVLGVWWF
jgi:hypothetical protein